MTEPTDLTQLLDQNQIREQHGLTFRQLDYWTRVGYIHALNDRPGSGNFRRWTPQEAAIAGRITYLTQQGFNVETAALLARDTDAIGRMIWTLTKLALNGEHP